MKKHITHNKFFKRLILVIGLFIVFPSLINAQITTEEINNRISAIDNEIKRLTYIREAIGLEFEAISNFSMQARPILVNYNQLVEATELKAKELHDHLIMNEKGKRLLAELRSLKTQQDNYLMELRKYNLMSFFGVSCNTIEVLQNEWQRTINYYQEKKMEYDDIALELEKLNKAKIGFVTDLSYSQDSWQVLDQKKINLEGCWQLRTGKYLSQIDVYDYGNNTFVGNLSVNNLEGYIDGQRMFVVQWVNGGTYRGSEFTNYLDNNGNRRSKEIPTRITINSDGNFLTWTSDETVTMQRCE